MVKPGKGTGAEKAPVPPKLLDRPATGDLRPSRAAFMVKIRFQFLETKICKKLF